MPKYYTIFMFVHQPGEHFTLFIKSFSAEFFTLFFFFLFCETFVFNLSIKLCLVKLLDGNFTFKFGPTGFWLAVCGLHSEQNKSGKYIGGWYEYTVNCEYHPSRISHFYPVNDVALI